MLEITDEREDWLVFETRNLIVACGADRYLSGHLVEPSPRFFPEPWAPDLESAEATTRRLLARVDLGGHVANFTSYAVYDENTSDDERKTVAGWFTGLEKGVALFGINTGKLHDPEALAGVMAHEVAHAFRAHHELVHAETAVDEELTDLTSVYLGFGILTANVASRTTVERDPWTATLRRSEAGYLAVDDLCFLLALQVVVRGYEESDIDRVARFLDSGQRVVFREAVRDLEQDREEMRERLGIRDLRPETRPIPSIPRVPPSDSQRWARPWGRTAYRARTFGVAQGVGWTFATAYCGGLFVPAFFGLPFRFLLPLWSVFTLVVGVLASLRGVHRCSSCRTKISSTAEECPSCLSLFVRTLENPPARFNVGGERGRRVFRVKGTCAARYAQLAGGAALLLSVIPTFAVVDLRAIFLPPLAAMVGGYVLGRRKRRDVCSAAACETELPPGISECPRCLGEIRGVIDDARDRLRADEEAARAG